MADFLVTGVAGFIGARVAELLLDMGHVVIGLDNLNDAYDIRMKEYRLRKLKAREEFDFFRVDISEKGFIDKHSGFPSRSFDAVINLAARAGVRTSLEDPWIYYQTNVIGAMNLLEMCRRRDIPKFIQASTSTVYGIDAPVPTPETADANRPTQPYAASKIAAEALCFSYHSLYDIDVSVVRYFTVYGPAGRPDMSMFRFVKWITEGEPIQLFGTGQQSRGFTYIDDIALGTIAALKPLGYEILNLGGHEVISMNDLILMMEIIIGKKAVIHHLPSNPGELQTNQADVLKAGQLLGWEPKVQLREGVRRLVDWYNSERAWVKEVSTR